MRKLTKQLSLIRDALLRQAWEEHKAELSMRDLGRIFNLTVSTVHQILKGRKKHE